MYEWIVKSRGARKEQKHKKTAYYANMVEKQDKKTTLHPLHNYALQQILSSLLVFLFGHVS